MASTTPKAPCVTCGKGTGVFKCEGCTQTFCTKHVVEHREILHHQLDEIIVEHDTLQEIIIENKDQDHSIINYIDEWERQSMKKIQQMAKEIRQTLADLININKKTISEELKLLTKRIKTAREEDDFFETDLHNWVTILHKLKKQLTNISLSNKIKEDQSKPIIYQLKLETISTEIDDKNIFKRYQNRSKMADFGDIFERCIDGGQIEDNGRLIVHNPKNCAVEFRGKIGYSSGTHRFHLQIEKSSLGTWIFFGIISKSEVMNKNSYDSPSAYGWADYDDFFLAGIRQHNQTTGQFSHTRENDIILLELDCINHTITYTNQRSQCNQQLNIDINQCPFPWQLHVNLFGEDDRVRLLSVMNSV